MKINHYQTGNKRKIQIFLETTRIYLSQIPFKGHILHAHVDTILSYKVNCKYNLINQNLYHQVNQKPIIIITLSIQKLS